MSAVEILELAAIFVTVVAVALTAMEKIWCWPVSLVSVALYGLFFFEIKLYADMGLQVVYGAFALYGWWAWLYGGENSEPLRITRVPRGQFVIALLLGAASTVLMATLLGRYTDAAVPWADSALTSFSLVAQWLMTRKHIESWPMWIVLDIFYFWLFLSRGWVGTALLYGVGFVIIAILGWIEWNRSRIESSEPPVGQIGAPEAT